MGGFGGITAHILNINHIFDKLANYEKTGKKPDFEAGLARVKETLRKMGNPQDKYVFIHVVGSKGKGSTVRMIEQGLIGAGHTVGSYYSPHIYRMNERIRVNGEEITDEELEKVVLEVASMLNPGDFTFFEFLTICMFKYFADIGVEYAVVEAGLGGRLDATNVAKEPKVVVLTRMEKEHAEILGDTIEKIEAEKLAVVRGGAKLFRFDEAGSNEEVARRVLGYLGIVVGEVRADLPARFEIKEVFGQECVFDMAHTVESAKLLRERLDAKYPGEKFFFLMGFLRDKNARGIIGALKRDGDRVLVVPLKHERAASMDQIVSLGEEISEEIPGAWPAGFRPVLCGCYLIQRFVGETS
ncbi:MAG: bifunctional folylpolyglutamate synthase/dihydrofolate synthase, dihydrofolate synthase / folylpolyglutamate synthase [Candidatus Peregrinibacteria bacterium GW2011_GWF2_43_17]|nr:MAG: bifunctional folylpolyglutamate synthase/dihydrofolate synthase, dihydrofolate synthase / folylpolyglutamate synthase [Candidatus Peregrinibacteria bacterium GW2011_GWF2_43_17]KKT18302.1 MAG: Folylpolyglutamate synthase [Candidatus Peregrinibacteria bacterium GW2011_GWA2_43_8]HAU39844.1 hypothetical protein [Candidatus Peregrinibacteria bacterium]